MTITNTEKNQLKQRKSVSLDKTGVDAWGVYVLFVETNKWNETHEHRVFVVDKMICSYKLQIGGTQTRTTWNRRIVDTREDAIAWLDGTTTKNYGGPLAPCALRAMAGAPVLVQLTESDVENVRKGAMPAARYRGQQKHQSIYGKVDTLTAFSLNMKADLPIGPRPATATAAVIAPPPASTATATITAGPTITLHSGTTPDSPVVGTVVGTVDYSHIVGDEPF